MGRYKGPSWYEDDVVEYTDSGKGSHPVIPEKYKICNLHLLNKGGTRKYKSFWSEAHAVVKLKNGIALYRKNGYPIFYKYDFERYKIFRCPQCGMYHIIYKKNYEKYLVKHESTEYRF